MKDLQIKSILRPLVVEVDRQFLEKTPFQQVQHFVADSLVLSNINMKDRCKLLADIKRQTSEFGLVKYLYNALLKYEGVGVYIPNFQR